MENATIGLFIKQLMKEKKISVAEMAVLLGLTRQAVYDFLKRKDGGKLSEIKRYADAMGVDVQDILDKHKNVNLTKSLQNQNNDDVFAKGDGYLMRYITELEERIKEQSVMLRTQAETITVLLGKSGSVPSVRFALPFFAAIGCKSGYTTLSTMLGMA